MVLLGIDVPIVAGALGIGWATVFIESANVDVSCRAASSSEERGKPCEAEGSALFGARPIPTACYTVGVISQRALKGGLHPHCLCF